ncbi:MAG: hypothetical protein ACRYFU_21610 [Janthinobacterium lividum]
MPHAFTLYVDAGQVTFAAVDPTLTLGGKHPHVGDSVPAGEAEADALKWSGLYAYVIPRTGNQLFLRVGDPDSPNLRIFTA